MLAAPQQLPVVGTGDRGVNYNGVSFYLPQGKTVHRQATREPCSFYPYGKLFVYLYPLSFNLMLHNVLVPHQIHLAHIKWLNWLYEGPQHGRESTVSEGASSGRRRDIII